MKKFFLLFCMSIICFTLGAQTADELYQEGKALYDAKSYKEAFPKLKAAAEQGHKKAQYRMGRCYDKGNGVREDDEQAFAWYSKAAAQGHAKSQYQLGKSYKNGEGVDKDYNKAFYYYSLAAKQGNGDAQLALGKCYLKGRGTAADQAKALEWFQKAVKNEKDGTEVIEKLREDASSGDRTSKSILKMLNMK